MSGRWHGQPHPGVAAGVPALSRNGAVRGRSLGEGQLCKSKMCLDTQGPLWQLGIEWESENLTVICPMGWELRDDPFPHVRIIAGGEITARYVVPVEPMPERNRLAPDYLGSVDWAAIGWDPGAPIADHQRPVQPEVAVDE